MLSGACNAVVAKTSRQCLHPAKYASSDGKQYCGHHKHLVSATSYSEVVEPPPVTEHATTTNNIKETNDHAKNYLLMLLNGSRMILNKGMYILLLLSLLFVVHYYVKQYYYMTCDSNLLKTWMFKKSPSCVVLNSFIQYIESWSIHGMSSIIRYAMVAFNDTSLIPLLSMISI